MIRPSQLVTVLGTDTEVGKTWLSAALLRAWSEAGLTVSARKPVQSFDPADDHPTDAEVLSVASGEPVSAVCIHSLAVPMAPPMAAVALGQPPLHLHELLDAGEFTTNSDVGVVEGVGGVFSPIADDADNVEFALALEPDAIVLVGDSRLGAINAVRGAVAGLRAHPGDLFIFLNRFEPSDDLHVANLEWLRDRDGLGVYTEPTELADAIRSVRSDSM